MQGKLILVLLTALGLGLAMAAVATLTWLRAYLLGRVDTQLTNTAHLAEHYINTSLAADHGIPSFDYDKSTDGNGWDALSQAGLLPSYLEIRDAHDVTIRRVMPGGPTPVLPANLVARIPKSQNAASFELSSLSPSHLEKFRVRVSRLPDGSVLALVVPVSDIEETVFRLAFVEMAIWTLTFGVVGWIATRRIRSALRPLDQIGDEAYAIRAGDLARRVTPTDADTEVGRLGIAVNTMLARLETAFAEGQASEDRLRRFVADASHELRTPLTSIRGYSELFRRGAAERPEDLALAMSRIESEAARMGVLVDELLLLARLDSGRPLEREPVDLLALASDAVADFRVAASEWPIELVHDHSGNGHAADTSTFSHSDHRSTAVITVGKGGVVVVGDADRLRQVLANLLSNARQHTPPGTSVRLSVRTEGETAVVEIADTGPGLDAEQCTRVFERFYRADASRSRSRAYGGTGLGLSIVEAVVAAHGGRAEARPNPVGGTVFAIEIPCAGLETTLTGEPQLSHSPSETRADPMERKETAA